MKQKIVFSAALLATLVSGPALSGDLDEENVQKSLANRVEEGLEQEGKDVPDGLNASDVKLTKVESASVDIGNSEVPLYAVQAIVSVEDEEHPVKLIVDESGKHEVSVNKLDTGKNAVQDAIDKMSRTDIPDDLGQELHSEDNGGKELFLVSDPFCPYCQKAFEYFKENIDEISEWRLLHLAPDNEQARTTVWAVMDGADVVPALELAEFAYTELEPKEGDGAEEIAAKFIERFPELEEKWGGPEQATYYLEGKYKEETEKNMEKARDELGVRATPQPYINGVVTEGWNKDRYADLLKKEEKDG